VAVPAANASNAVAGLVLSKSSERMALGLCFSLFWYLEIFAEIPPGPGAFEPGLPAVVRIVASFYICSLVALTAFHLARCTLMDYL